MCGPLTIGQELAVGWRHNPLPRTGLEQPPEISGGCPLANYEASSAPDRRTCYRICGWKLSRRISGCWLPSKWDGLTLNFNPTNSLLASFDIYKPKKLVHARACLELNAIHFDGNVCKEAHDLPSTISIICCRSAKSCGPEGPLHTYQIHTFFI